MLDHEVVEFAHRHAAALATALALCRLTATSVIAVSAALAGSERHSAAACGTVGKSREEGRPRDDPGWRHLGVSRLQGRLDAIEDILLDDDRDPSRDPFGAVL